MRVLLYIVSISFFSCTLFNAIKNYRVDRDFLTKAEIIGSVFALTGLLFLIAAKVIEHLPV